MRSIVTGIVLLWASCLAGQQPCAPQVNLGSNISFCSGNAITLDATWPNSTYRWSTGATSPPIMEIKASGAFLYLRKLSYV